MIRPPKEPMSPGDIENGSALSKVMKPQSATNALLEGGLVGLAGSRLAADAATTSALESGVMR
jgi:hypothetical protein